MNSDDKKVSIFGKIKSLINFSIVLLFPSFKILALNKFLTKSYEVTEQKWFLKQKKKNYLLAILFFIPLIMNVSKSYRLVANDTRMSDRIEMVANSQLDIIDTAKAYYFTLAFSEKDLIETKRAKFETQSRILASFFVLMIGLGFQGVLAILVYYYHPLINDSNKLRQLLVQNGVWKEDVAKKMIVFATPLGFLIDIRGNTPEHIRNLKSVWDELNLKVKDFQEHPDQMTLIFLEKRFELANKYIYDFSFLETNIEKIKD